MTSKKRIIFFQACQQVANAFVGDGFKFIKSRQAMERKHSVFKDSVPFKSSISINKLPRHIHFEVRAYTSSQIMAEWQEAHGAPFGKNGVIGSGSVENLFTPGPPYIRYDIGDPETRAKVIQRVISAVRTHALRFFDIACDPQQLCDALENGSIPAFNNPAHIIEYFLCTDNRALIPRYLNALNQQWPDLIAYAVSYHRRAQTEGIAEQGFSDAWGSRERVTAARIAQAMAHYNLTDAMLPREA